MLKLYSKVNKRKEAMLPLNIKGLEDQGFCHDHSNTQGLEYTTNTVRTTRVVLRREQFQSRYCTLHRAMRQLGACPHLNCAPEHASAPLLCGGIVPTDRDRTLGAIGPFGDNSLQIQFNSIFISHYFFIQRIRKGYYQECIKLYLDIIHSRYSI
jgi:hypothetical protein